MVKFTKMQKRDIRDGVSLGVGVAGLAISAVGLALALNEKPMEPIKFRKERGQDVWIAGSPDYHIVARKRADGSLLVDWEKGTGQRKSKGSLVAPDLQSAAVLAADAMASSLSMIRPERRKAVQRGWDEDFFDEADAPVCINCGEWQTLQRLDEPGYVYRCPRCGCVFDRGNEQVLYDRWDHGTFDGYRREQERRRSEMFASGPVYFSEGGRMYEYTPEAFDSDWYSALANFKVPKDRSRILSFNRRLGRRRDAMPRQVYVPDVVSRVGDYTIRLKYDRGWDVYISKGIEPPSRYDPDEILGQLKTSVDSGRPVKIYLTWTVTAREAALMSEAIRSGIRSGGRP